jgi:hypothetical protein
MPLKVASFSTYLSMPGAEWRQDDYAAYKFVRAVKGRTINRYARVPVNGQRRLLEQANANDAVDWFAEMVAAKIKRRDSPLILVPVPNSSCVAEKPELIPRTLALAEALARRWANTSVLDCLRWEADLGSASSGHGTRDPQTLYENFVVTAEIPEATFALVDDVKTTGAHLQAARTVLLRHGATCEWALCAARTVQDQSQDPFSFLAEKLPDWEPN